jgi:D-sedoheptulose 7-phosphate isomerase
MMKETTKLIYDALFERYPALAMSKNDVMAAYLVCEEVYRNGGKILVCGNGGSASDSEHIVGELMKQFKKKRRIDEEIYDALGAYGKDGEIMRERLEGNLPAISLTSHLALTTAFANDTEPSLTFAQQLLGLGEEGDALISISTSGNSKNCVYATILAKVKGLKTISLTGEKESRLSELSDVTVRVPESETYLIQEYHLPIYHALCAMLEEEFFQ